MSRLARAVRRLVFCVGSANEIPLQNSSTFNKFCCPYLVCRLRRVDVVFAGRCGVAVQCFGCALRESRRFFCGSAYLLIGATRALLKALSELQIGALCNLQLCHHQSESPL